MAAVYRMPFIVAEYFTNWPWNVKGNWDSPIKHHKLGQPFGYDHGFDGDPDDFFACIYAARAGTVIDARNDVPGPDNKLGPGNYVFIRHADNTVMLYAHMAPGSVSVSVGQYVPQATLLGTVGETGNAFSGVHLHVEALTRYQVFYPPGKWIEGGRGNSLISHFEDGTTHYPGPWRPITDEILGTNPLLYRQDGWRFCHWCASLFFSYQDDLGWCPHGGPHAPQGGNYTLMMDEDGPGESGWRHCWKCAMLFTNATQYKSNCPVALPGDGQFPRHDGSLSGNYRVKYESFAGSNDEVGWRHCNKCQSMFFGPAQSSSTCPTDGGIHKPFADHYALHLSMEDHQRGWRRCGKCQGLFFEPNGVGVCQATGGHSPSGLVYTLCMNVSPFNPGYTDLDFNFVNHDFGAVMWHANFRWCHKCNLLFYPGETFCPATGTHSQALSGEYFLTFVSGCPGASEDTSCAGGLGDPQWRVCNKCSTLFRQYDGNQCAKDNDVHVAEMDSFEERYALMNDNFLGPVIKSQTPTLVAPWWGSFELFEKPV